MNCLDAATGTVAADSINMIGSMQPPAFRAYRVLPICDPHVVLAVAGSGTGTGSESWPADRPSRQKDHVSNSDPRCQPVHHRHHHSVPFWIWRGGGHNDYDGDTVSSTPSPLSSSDELEESAVPTARPPKGRQSSKQKRAQSRQESGGHEVPSSDDVADDGSTGKKQGKKRGFGFRKEDRTDSPLKGSTQSKTNKNTESSSQSQPQHEKQKQKQKQSAAQQNSSSQTETRPEPPVSPAIQEILQQDDYYGILGLDRNQIVTMDDENRIATVITKAYRRRAVVTHPDKTHGDRRAFDKVAEAYAVLSDTQLRQIYHRHGKRGLEQHRNAGGSSPFANAGGGHGMGVSPEDFLRSFFGGGGAGARGSASSSFFEFAHQPRRRNRNVRYQLEVTLEDLYQGMTKMVMIAPPDSIDPFHRSSSSSRPKRVQVHVPAGAYHGESIRLAGEMDFDPTETPGDVIFALQQRPHETFTRQGHDLAMAMHISLQEAICGVVHRPIDHLNGQRLHVSSAHEHRERRHRNGSAGDGDDDHDDAATNDHDDDALLIRHGDVQVLKGYGMPKDGTGSHYGDLYVQFQVDMPSTIIMRDVDDHHSKRGALSSCRLTREERHELRRLLDKLSGETTIMANTKETMKGAHQAGRKKPSETTEAGEAVEDDATNRDDGSRQHHDDNIDNSNNEDRVLQLEPASLSDFGRTSDRSQRTVQDDEDQGVSDEDQDSAHSFFSSSSSPHFGRQWFFSSRTTRSNPFGFFGSTETIEPDAPHDEEHVQQCRQM